MKRFSVMLIIGVLLLTACAPKASPAAEVEEPAAEEAAVVESEEGEAEEEKYTIGVAYEGPTNDWAAALLYHLQYSFDIKYKDKVEQVYYESADGDATKQVSQVENLLAKDIDALMLQPLSETAMVPLVEQAYDAGIPVIIFGSSVLTDKYTSYIDRDNYGTGYKFASYMCESMGGEGKVVAIMGEPGSGYSENVLRGVTDGLAECPDIVNLGVDYGEYSPALSKQKMETFLAANPDIGGVITDGALMAMGVLEAYVDADLPLPYVTCDDWNGFQNVAMELDFDKYITVPGGSEASGIAADVLFDYLAGNEVDKEYIIPLQVFTGEEVQAMIPEGMPDSYWALNRIPVEYVDLYWGE